MPGIVMPVPIVSHSAEISSGGAPWGLAAPTGWSKCKCTSVSAPLVRSSTALGYRPALEYWRSSTGVS